MDIINIDSLPLSIRLKTYVKLTYNFGYDEIGNYGRYIGEVSVVVNGEYIHDEYKTNYIELAKDLAIQKAKQLGLDFIYVSYS